MLIRSDHLRVGSLVILLLVGTACRPLAVSDRASDGAAAGDKRVAAESSRDRRETSLSPRHPGRRTPSRGAAPFRVGHPASPDDATGRTPVTLQVDRAPLAQVLTEIAEGLSLQLLLDEAQFDGLTLSIRVEALPLHALLSRLEGLFPIRFERRGRVLEVHGREGPRLSLLVYPLPGGLLRAELPNDFDSLRQLSFISRVQRQESEGGDAFSDLSAEDSLPEGSHLERFLAQLPGLVRWPEGSAWFLDRRHNLLFVRGDPSVLDQVERCLDLVCQPAQSIEIEARFLELSEGAARDIGVELGLTESAPLHSGEEMVSLSADSGTRVGIPNLLPGLPSGLNLEVLGIMSEPRFRAVLRAIESSEEAEVLSAPTVTSVNNSRATIAITTNLPYVEAYEPVFDTTVVSSDGISASDANVALVAVVNDRNFTGIVLNVTPSLGSDLGRLHLRIQPVVRDQVDAITIPGGAVVQGVETPPIARPVIETRYIDTQLVVPDGGTVVLGGLRSTVERTQTVGVPILSRIPLLGFFFRREVLVREQRDLMIFVTARRVTVPPKG